MPKYIRFQPLRIEIIFISKSSHITKAELFFVYGYGFVLTSLNYKEKGKKAKAIIVIQLIFATIEKSLKSVKQT